ncbi:MAG TPA: hypothetical protein VHY84_23100 [Bryobacteraceae bacterium]|jgi:hypothetical protein|nr:hypothetical protein [Bryobacteraceae bacterium]
MPENTANRVTKQIIDFLVSIGIRVVSAEVLTGAFLPGIRVDRGTLIVDESRLDWPGDLLHEAAHLAMAPVSRREGMGENAGDDGGEELGAIAWSWAAAIHLGLDPEIVFHAGGYRGGSASILENFRDRRYIGVPYLRWIGLTSEDYPAMIRWLRD